MKSYSEICISKKNLLHNLKFLEKKISADCKGNIIAVVKANAYGHGTEIVSRILYEGGVRIFAVSSFYEAKTVLDICPFSRILTLCFPAEPEKCVEYGIEFTATSFSEILKAEKIAEKQNRTAIIHLKINTGMNRLGFFCKSEFDDAAIYIRNSKHLKLAGVFTHFCSIKSNEILRENQFKTFCEFIKDLKYKDEIVFHCGGGEITEFFNKYNSVFTHVRIGLKLYGYGESGLKKVMSAESRVINQQFVKKGDFVGYGGKNPCEKNMLIAVVPFGYADGMPRNLGNGEIEVKIKNRLCKTVGNICMDYFMADVSEISEDIKNEKVIIMSDAETWAKALNTIPYEILTNMKSDRININVR